MLGLDYGTRRIGVAVSDGLQITAQPHSTLDARSDVIHAIKDLVAELDVQLIVVGLPISLDGSEGPAAMGARRLATELTAAVDVPVEMHDERFTTRVAEAALLEGNITRKRRRQVVDRVAAALMLQGFLDRP